MSISDVQQAAVTSLCNMTAFVTAGFLQHPDSKTVAKVIFTQVLLPNGIPKMVLLDQDSLFKTDLVDILDHLGVPFHVVSPEQHEAFCVSASIDISTRFNGSKV
jgi:hypothetical protein